MDKVKKTKSKSASAISPRNTIVDANFKFETLNEFFPISDGNQSQWIKIKGIEDVVLNNIVQSETDPTMDQILFTLMDSSGITCFMAIDFITADIFRLRFNPTGSQSYYTEANTATTVQDTYSGLRDGLNYYNDRFNDFLDFPLYTKFSMEEIANDNTIYSCLTIEEKTKKDILQIDIHRDSLCISITNCVTKRLVWQCNLNKMYFKAQISYTDKNSEDNNVVTDYAIAISIAKQATSKYIGFGEKGGATLCKNGQQLSYFNFDNMRYKSIYGIGEFDAREPLYHSNPFFLEFSGIPNQDNNVIGSFVNNPSEVLMDIGCTYSDELQIATSYGDMDMVVFVGEQSKEVVGKATAISGKSRLKPRYALGFHQGGYGYEDTQAMLDVVNGYGDSDIPFDGLHVDVDVQNYYRTFTMNEDKYRRICIDKNGKAGPVCNIDSNNTVLVEHNDGNGNKYIVEAIDPKDGSILKAINDNGELIEAKLLDGKYVGLKNEDGTPKKVGAFLFEYLLKGHNTWVTNRNLKVKCSTNITPVVSNPYVMENQDQKGIYRTLKSGLDGGYFVKYKKAIDDSPSDKASYDGSDYNGVYLGGVYYGQDAEGKELGSFGHYPDFGNRDTRLWWGQQYKDLIKAGLSMVWQDMTTPAISINQNLQKEGESWFNFSLWNGTKNIEKGTNYKNLCCSYKSFPFNLLLTNNFDKRYESDSVTTRVDPVGKIRNLYSYNLHKATYHGINNIWKINEMSFTWVILKDKALNKEQSTEVLNLLLGSGKILQETDSTFSCPCYVVKSAQINADVQNALNNSAYESVVDEVCQVLYDSKALEIRQNERNFIVGRGGFNGMHRFAALWTGDNASTWNFLKINVAQMLALGLSGQANAGADIGGFENPEQGGGKWADPELVLRWTILGAFLPWFRNHYRRKGTKEFQELYKFQDYADFAPQDERFMYRSVLPVSKLYIKLRYKLMQLFYDAMFENTITGMPIARPMFLQDHDDTMFFNDKINFLNNQFLIGESLMVAPVMDKQKDLGNGKYEAKRDIYFPVKSCWYQFLHHKKALMNPEKGGTTTSYDATINQSCSNPNSEHSMYVLPLYVREGAILPMTDGERYCGAYYEDNKQSLPVTINLYPSPNQKETNYRMFLDDGISRSSAPVIDKNYGGDPQAKGEYRQVNMNYNSSDNWNRSLVLDTIHDGIDPEKYKLCPYYFIAILHDPNEPIILRNGNAIDSICEVKINDKKIPFFAATSDGNAIVNHFNNADYNNWYFNTNLNTSFIKVFDESSIKISFTNI